MDKEEALEPSALRKRFCVFLGSKGGNDPSFEQQAFEFGKEMANRGVDLVYGGLISSCCTLSVLALILIAQSLCLPRR